MQAASLSELKPIMPDVEMAANILPYLLFALLLLFLLLLMLLRFFRKRKPQPSPQAAALQRLRQMDPAQGCDAQMLYRFSLDVKSYLGDREDKAFEALQEALALYKYQADAPAPKAALCQQIAAYIRTLK